jgi:hypothetical protein
MTPPDHASRVVICDAGVKNEKAPTQRMIQVYDGAVQGAKRIGWPSRFPQNFGAHTAIYDTGSRRISARAKGVAMPGKLSLATFALLACSAVSSAQTTQALVNQPPSGAQNGLLLTDGRVLSQSYNGRAWYALTPDITGSYVNGTWAGPFYLPPGYAPLANAQAVLADGRAVVVGGEYIGETFTLSNRGAIFDPVTDTWTNLPPPPGWLYIGDSPSVVLPDGGFMIGDKLNQNMAILNPETLHWATFPGTGKADINAEEGWTLLADGSVLTCDVTRGPNTEIFSLATKTWKGAGDTPANLNSPGSNECVYYGPNDTLCYHPAGEIGPAMLRPDGTVFATGSREGSVTHNAIYDTNTGVWTAGPDFPNGDDAGDNYAALEPSGNVLVLTETSSGYAQAYEWDGTNLTSILSFDALIGPLIVLPNGQVLAQGLNAAGFGVEVYNPTGTYQSSWAPTISSVPSSVNRGQTYKIYGTQFNGLSQAAAFGDEFQNATNYPIVRITNNATGHVFYARTHNHSTMGVATGSAMVSTSFDVPSGAETGASTLEVVANGIPSLPVSITVN